MVRIASCVCFCCHNILFLHTVWQRFPVVNALKFHCYREIPRVNQELTFDKRISCINIFHQEVIRQFHCKLLLSSEIVKVEAIVMIIKPIKPNRKQTPTLSYNQQQEEHYSLLAKFQLKRMWNNRVQWGNRLLNQHSF